jgi:MFS family permease
MVGPLFAQEIGLRPEQIAWFLAAFVLGGALAQIPVGWFADRHDRRWVLIWLSAAAIPASALTVAATQTSFPTLLAASALFGFVTFPIYSVAAAHAHDFAAPDERVELSAALMFFFACGAIAAPIAASTLIDLFGPMAMFVLIGAGHAVLILFGLLRMTARPGQHPRTRYIWAPRTSFLVGRLTGRTRDH